MEKKEPLVSITIPCYNHEKFVKKTLNSILNDSYSNKEIIIIDDCSKDNSWAEIENWANENKSKINIYYKRNEKNLGVSKTVNYAREKAKGTYIVGIASDDELIDGSIQKRIDYLSNNPTKKVVFGDCEVIDENGNITFNSGLSELYTINKDNLHNNDSIKKELILNWGVPGGTLMIKKELAKEIPFNEKLIVEDFDLFLKWMSKDYLGFIDSKISRYRIHSSNVSRDKSLQKKRYLDFIRTILSNLKNFRFKYKLILLYAIVKRVLSKLGIMN